MVKMATRPRYSSCRVDSSAILKAVDCSVKDLRGGYSKCRYQMNGGEETCRIDDEEDKQEKLS